MKYTTEDVVKGRMDTWSWGREVDFDKLLTILNSLQEQIEGLKKQPEDIPF